MIAMQGTPECETAQLLCLFAPAAPVIDQAVDQVAEIVEARDQAGTHVPAGAVKTRFVLLAYLDARPGCALTQRDVAAGTHVPYETTKKMLQRIAKAGECTQTPQGYMSLQPAAASHLHLVA